jgi:hypothetical protein
MTQAAAAGEPIGIAEGGCTGTIYTVRGIPPHADTKAIHETVQFATMT